MHELVTGKATRRSWRSISRRRPRRATLESPESRQLLAGETIMDHSSHSPKMTREMDAMFALVQHSESLRASPNLKLVHARYSVPPQTVKRVCLGTAGRIGVVAKLARAWICEESTI